MTHVDAIDAAGALDRPVMHGEDHDLTLMQRHDFGALGVPHVRRAERAPRRDLPGVAQHDAVVGGAYELAIGLPSGLDPEALVAVMFRDKKVVNGLTFVLDGPAGVETVAAVPPEAALAAISRMPRQSGDGTMGR